MLFPSAVFLFFFLPLLLILYYDPLLNMDWRYRVVGVVVSAVFLIWVLFGFPKVVAFGIFLGIGVLLAIITVFFPTFVQKELFFSGRTIRNFILLVFSLFFYAWGEPVYVLLLIFSILMNYAFGLAAGRFSRTLTGRWIVAGAVLCNVAVFFVFKYMDFVFQNCNKWLHMDLPLSHFALPLGISFYTFQALSYVIDVYRGTDVSASKNGQDSSGGCLKAEKNPLTVALYISLFPQLIAGPIVRYGTVAQELSSRAENKRDFSSGMVRFAVGLGKKVILANPCAFIADLAFNGSPDGASVLLAWMGAIAYTMQIYFDFSGYSDMAIGLGRMFGFHFPENFNFPYIARSITDFWRRWHISLSTWFRDYVYFPLGGSRVDSKRRLVFNLFVVWMLTGIWHGANWTFVFWGFFYFVLLTIEKLTGLDKKKTIWGYLYTMPCVIFAWVFFRADTMRAALRYVKTMLGIGNVPFYTDYAVFQ